MHYLFKNLKLTLLAAMFCLTAANAVTVAILEITIASNDDEDFGLTVDETKFLSDELRRQAIRILPKDYSVLTREKIISLIPDTAENLNSVINIGMVIKSDYVTRGSIGKLGSLFTLTVELYETATGNLLGDFVKESSDVKGLLEIIRENSPSLFANITQAGTLNNSQQQASIPTNIPAESSKTKTSLWVAIGLDVLGATAIGLGIYNNAQANGYYKDSQNLLEDVYKSGDKTQYDNIKEKYGDKQDKMKSAENRRPIFYATGGALLLGGVAVHIWF